MSANGCEVLVIGEGLSGIVQQQTLRYRARA